MRPGRGKKNRKGAVRDAMDSSPGAGKSQAGSEFDGYSPEEAEMVVKRNAWLVEHETDKDVNKQTFLKLLDETYPYRVHCMQHMTSVAARDAFKYLFLRPSGVSKTAGAGHCVGFAVGVYGRPVPGAGSF